MSKKIKINHVKAEQELEVRKPVNVNHWSYSRGSDIIKGGIDLVVAGEVHLVIIGRDMMNYLLLTLMKTHVKH